jgi:hypothetical protein
MLKFSYTIIILCLISEPSGALLAYGLDTTDEGYLLPFREKKLLMIHALINLQSKEGAIYNFYPFEFRYSGQLVSIPT